MKKTAKRVFSLCLALCLALALAACGGGDAGGGTRVSVDKKSAVMDHAEVLSEETETYVTNLSVALQETCGAQIGVYTVDYVGNNTTEGYAYSVFSEWGLGDKDKNNGILSASIDSMVVRITNIAGELNFYTAAPQGSPRTVAFPLVRSVDGTQMSNATVMLFPSFGKPEFQMSIILKNGNVKSFKQTLNGPLEANSKLTLTLTLGDIFSEESSGEFTLDNWNEESQTIDVPSLD